MNLTAIFGLPLSLVLLAASGMASADEKKPAKAPAATPRAAAALPGASLPDTQRLYTPTSAMRLQKSLLPPGPAIPPASSRPGSVLTHDPIISAIEEWKRASAEYGAAGLAFRAKRDSECPAKEYSTSDQLAAGCTGTDTIAACNVKLYEKCWLPSYTHWGVTQRKFLDARRKVDTAFNEYMSNVGVTGYTR